MLYEKFVNDMDYKLSDVLFIYASFGSEVDTFLLSEKHLVTEKSCASQSIRKRKNVILYD